MRYRIPIVLVLLICMIVAHKGMSQSRNTFSNTFLSAGLGGNYYINSNRGSMGAGAELSFGKWFINTTGLRCQFSDQLADGGYLGSRFYMYGHVDIFNDVISSLKGRNPSNRFRSFVIVGVGLVHSNAGDNDFCGYTGIGADYRIGRDWRLYAELGGYVQPSGFDYNDRFSFLALMKTGIVYDILVNPTRSRSRRETKSFVNDWFFQGSLGASSFNYRGISSMRERLSLLTPILEFGVGKRLTSLWCVRLSATGLYARSAEELFTYYNIHGDIMLDMAGWLFPDKPLTPFTARPYLSACVLSRLDDQRHFLFAPAGGIQFALCPDSRNEIYVDMRYLVSPPRFARVSESQSTLSVGLATFMLGYCYNFSKRSFR